MGRLSDDKKSFPLKNLLLPGSNYSALYFIDFENSIYEPFWWFSSDFFKPTIRSWFQHQNYNIPEQLEKGIRFIDIKYSFNPNDRNFYCTHLYASTTLKKVLDDIIIFTQEYPTEVVIININSDQKHKDITIENIDYLFEMLNDMELMSECVVDMSLDEIIENGCNVILTTNEKFSILHESKKPIKIHYAPFIDTTKGLKLNVDYLENEQCTENQNHALSFAYPVSFRTVLIYPNLQYVAKETNSCIKELLDYYESQDNPYSAIIMDYVEEDYVNTIIEYNMI